MHDEVLVSFRFRRYEGRATGSSEDEVEVHRH